MAYPSSIDNGTTLPYPTATDDTNSPSLSSGQSVQNNAIIALETLVGTNSSQTAPIANTVLTSPANGSNEWQGLTSAFVASSTGTGEFVFANSPTLSSPTITTPTFSGTLGNVSVGTISATGAASLTSVTTTGQITLQNTTAPSAGGATTDGLLLSSTASLGIFFGNGAPTFSAAQGSIYLNTTGSSTSTRLYVNTNGSTSWTNFTSAA